MGYDRDGRTMGYSSGAKLVPVKLQWDFNAAGLADINLAYKDSQLLIKASTAFSLNCNFNQNIFLMRFFFLIRKNF